MNYEATKAFEKDLNHIRHPKLLRQIRDVLKEIEAADSISSVTSVTAMAGYPNYYRVRIGDYRLGCRLEGSTLVLARCLLRKEIYRYFP